MKTIYLFFGLIILFALPSCTQRCDCDLVYKSENETGGLWFNSETKKPYTGICERLYGSGKIRVESKYKEGKTIYEKEFYESGKVKFHVKYDANGKKMSIAEWYANGEKATETTYKEGGILSSRKGWYSNGNDSIDYVCNSEGKFIQQKEYYSNKRIKMDIQFTEHYLNLVAISEANFTNLKEKIIIPNSYFYSYSCKTGSKIYYENGQIAAEIIEPFEKECNITSFQFNQFEGEYMDFTRKIKVIFHSIFYLPNGYISNIGVETEIEYKPNNDAIIPILNKTLDNVSKAYTSNLKLEETKDFQKLIKVIVNNNKNYATSR